MYDILIKHASIIDGTGTPAFCADVAIINGKLLINPPLSHANKKIDASGLILCPGFIDAHSHSDRLLGIDRCSTLSKVSQGITTEITGQCGSSNFPSSTDAGRLSMLSAYVGVEEQYLEKTPTLDAFNAQAATLPIANHYLIYTGHGALRIAAMGFERRKPTYKELERMKDLLREAMEQGSVGISTGLIYSPSCYSDEDELVELCKVVAEYDGIYATHMRNEAKEVVESVAEAIRIAERSGCRLCISHHKICGKENWGKSVQTLQLIHEAVKRGVRITLDVYPYTASCTALNVCLPDHFFSHGPEKMLELLKDPNIREDLRNQMEELDGRYRHCGGWSGILVTIAPNTPDSVGLTVQEYADRLGRDAFDVFFDMVVDNGRAAQAIFFSMDEADLQRITCDENAVIGTDSVIYNMETPTHPRGLGTFPKAIRYFVKEHGLMTMEQMIHKMTGLPAQRFGLNSKGIIANGYDADLLLFDPDNIRDVATYTDSLQLSEGIECVIVDGEIVYQNKQLTGCFPGRFIPYRQIGV